MSSVKQQQANRLNSQKSTGPRTLQGRAVSRFNALQTGIHAESRVIPGEDPAELAAIAGDHHQRWQPSLPEHRVLVDALAHGEWQLRRLHKAEASMWRHHNPEDKPWDGAGSADFARLQRRMDSTGRTFLHALEKLESLAGQATPAEAAAPEPAPAGEPDAPVSRPPIKFLTRQFQEMFQPKSPARQTPPSEKLPDRREPVPPQNQCLNPEIGFVPSTPTTPPTPGGAIMSGTNEPVRPPAER